MLFAGTIYLPYDTRPSLKLALLLSEAIFLLRITFSNVRSTPMRYPAYFCTRPSLIAALILSDAIFLLRITFIDVRSTLKQYSLHFYTPLSLIVALPFGDAIVLLCMTLPIIALHRNNVPHTSIRAYL